MAKMIYIHDPEEEFLYALAEIPTVTAKNNRHGDNKAWKVSVDVAVSTPHNQFKRNRWRIPLSQTYKTEYPTSRKQPDIIAAFKAAFYPDGQLISEKEYLALKKDYDAKSGVSW